jgi:16S rRNA (guanine527-N7)-methyltransferase
MNRRTDFIAKLGLKLSEDQFKKLETFAALVLEKEERLNLTSVKDGQEIWDRHIADGLTAAALIAQKAGGRRICAADFGAGAGFIGITVKVALDNAEVALIESLEKRCKFMEWICFKLALKNVKVLNIRAGNVEISQTFDFTTERAMGKIDAVLPLCAKPLKEGGYFMPYQAFGGTYSPAAARASGVKEEGIYSYILPGEDKTRKIVLFRK